MTTDLNLDTIANLISLKECNIDQEGPNNLTAFSMYVLNNKF